MTVWIYKAELAYFFGMYSLAELILLEDMAAIGQTTRHHFSITLIYFLGGVTHFQLYRTYGVRKHLKVARKYQKSLDRISHCPNAIPYLVFLRAKALSVRYIKNNTKSSTTANKNLAVHETCLTAYDETIAEMKRVEWVHMEALANERAGFYLASPHVGEFAKVEYYFNTAMQLYKSDWGAIAKYEWLREECGKILKRELLKITSFLRGKKKTAQKNGAFSFSSSTIIPTGGLVSLRDTSYGRHDEYI
jgi:hypothetical protein